MPVASRNVGTPHGHKEEVNLKKLSVEHVLPQMIDTDDGDGESWQRMLGTNWRTLHEKWLHTLGNLTLTGYNPELGNGSFADKKAEFAGSNVSLNGHFAGHEQWSEQEIKQRGLELARIVAGIWPRPGGGPGYIVPAPTPPEPEELFGRPNLVKRGEEVEANFTFACGGRNSASLSLMRKSAKRKRRQQWPCFWGGSFAFSESRWLTG